jgi:hypothetical protein
MAVMPIPVDPLIDAVTAAVFATPGVWVAEANSDFDIAPRQFSTAGEMSDCAKERLSKARGSASFFVTYPDMGGRAILKTIHLNPGSVPGHALRYTWEGWGLISVLLTRGDQPNDASRIAVNSEKRAIKWEPVYPTFEPASTWNWKAVAKHARRLQRVLDRFSPQRGGQKQTATPPESPKTERARK